MSRIMAAVKLHTITIEKLVTGGFGLGRLDDGMVVLVRHGLPGEKLVVRETGRQRDFITGSLHDILSASPVRIKPPCPIYGRCGGCDLQHVSYREQLRFKKEIIGESLQRAGGEKLSGLKIEIEPTVASPAEFGYRQRIRLQVDDQGHYGFFRTGSHFLEKVTRCLLAHEAINSVLGQLHLNEAFAELVNHCTLFELLFDPDRNNVILLLHFKRKPRSRDTLLAANLSKETSRLSTVLMMVAGHGLYDPQARSYAASPPSLSQTFSSELLKEDIVLTWEAGSFCQVNLGQNRNLINLVLKIIKKGLNSRILDLFCGHGNFSLPVARLAGEVIGMESQNAAVRSGRRNVKLNRITNCRFIKSPVVEGISNLTADGEKFTSVILDPPREGAASAVSGISDLGAGQVIYISCNPATLARDLTLFHSCGYEPVRLVPLDMFPQTHHMESLTLLQRTPH